MEEDPASREGGEVVGVAGVSGGDKRDAKWLGVSLRMHQSTI